MGKKWSTVSISGYKAGSPTDDGAATENNRVKYSTIYTDLTDPIKTGVDSVVSELDQLFTEATTPVASAYTTVASDHAVWLEVTGTTTITLLAASTAGAGYRVGVKNAGSNTVTVARSGADTIDGDTSQSLAVEDSALYVVNGAGDGYIEANRFSSQAGSFDVNGLSAETSIATDDTVPFYDDDASGNKKITAGNIRTFMGGLSLPLSGGALTGNLDVGGNVLSDPLDPTADGHVGDRAYNDARYQVLSTIGSTDGFFATTTADQTLTDNTLTTITFSATGEVDPGGHFTPATGIYVVPSTGYYAFTGRITTETQLNSAWYMRLLIESGNLGRVATHYQAHASTASRKSLGFASVLYLTVSDTIKLRASFDEDAGSTSVALDGNDSQGNGKPFFCGLRIL